MPASNGLAAPRRAPATKRSRPIATPRGKPSRANWSSTSPAAGRHPTTANHRLRWRRRNRAPHLRTTSSPHGRRASQRAAIIAGTEISGVTARPLAGTTSHTAPTHAARLYPESPSPEPTNDDIAGPPEIASALGRIGGHAIRSARTGCRIGRCRPSHPTTRRCSWPSRGSGRRSVRKNRCR